MCDNIIIYFNLFISYFYTSQILQLIENDLGNGFFKHFAAQAGRFNEFVDEMYGRVYIGGQFLFGAEKLFTIVYKFTSSISANNENENRSIPQCMLRIRNDKLCQIFDE